MSINVKKVKRVLLTSSTQNKEPLKEFNAGDKMPAFRQNGYQLDFNNATNAKITYNSVDYPQTTLITSFVAEGKTWLFDESKGDTIESETGEIATISIDEDDDFLNANVWNKKSFALAFDAANSDYLEIINANEWATVGDVDFEFDFLFSNVITFIPIFSRSSSATNRIEINLRDDGDLFTRFENNGVSVVAGSFSDLLIEGTKHNIKYKDSKFYLDGVELDDNSSVSTTSLTAGSEDIYISARPSTSQYQNSTFYNLDINGETINLTEGLGNEVEGSSGTAGAIYTSHASGTERINYGMWLKGNDTDGWNPYT